MREGIMTTMTRRLLSTADAAMFLGVAPATIRDWKRQGLVEPRARNAWDIVELRAAQQAPKPRSGQPRVQPTAPYLLTTPKAAVLLGTTTARFLRVMRAVGVHPSAGSSRRPLWDQHTVTCAWAARPADVSYLGAHRRVYRARGQASTHMCAFCHVEPATSWAYRTADASEAWTERQPGGRVLVYSTNPEDYDPACGPCHQYIDTRHRSMSA